jgi:molybdopterin molybdotransferase
MIKPLDAEVCLRAHLLSLGSENVLLAEARGRVLAAPLFADRDGPPFHRVAMDGIGITHEAFLTGQKHYKCEGIQAAGSPQMQLSDSEACCEVMTGAVLPAGCDVVVPFERVTESDGSYRLEDDLACRSMMNVHQQGEDFKKGEEVLQAPCVLNSTRLAIAASLGYAELEVKRLPSIAIVTTGSELVNVETLPLPHQIRKSNVHAGAAALKTQGFVDLTLHHLPDDKEETRRALAEALTCHDVVIISGGVSKGKLDFVPGALEAIGVQKQFHRVAQKPGKPIWVGNKGDKMVFGLPGNPASMLVCLERYVIPFLKASLGVSSFPLSFRSVQLLPVKEKLTMFKTVQLVTQADGEVADGEAAGETKFALCKDHGSGDFAALGQGDGFVEIPPASESWPTTRSFRFYPWS